MRKVAAVVCTAAVLLLANVLTSAPAPLPHPRVAGAATAEHTAANTRGTAVTSGPPPPVHSAAPCAPAATPAGPPAVPSLDFLSGWPDGVVVPTRPAVYIVTREAPAVLFSLLQHELVALDHLRVLSQGGVLSGQVMDVGAGHGAFAVYAAKLGHSVAAFESVPQLAEAVEKSAELNRVHESVTVHNEFVFDQSTNTVFKGAGVLKASHALDAFIAPQDRVGLLRVGTQAHEAFVLRSADTAFSENLVGHVLLELTSSSRPRLVQGQKVKNRLVASTAADAHSYLVSKGYEAWLLRSPCMQQTQLQYTADDLKLTDDFDVQAHRLTPAEADSLFVSLEQNPSMKGMTCLLWFKRGPLQPTTHPTPSPP